MRLFYTLQPAEAMNHINDGICQKDQEIDEGEEKRQFHDGVSKICGWVDYFVYVYIRTAFPLTSFYIPGR